MKNNWYVVTGGPCAGKTSVLEILEQRGYLVQYEAARIYIDEQIELGKTLNEIRADEGNFQRDVLKQKIQIERELPPEKIVFFDRAIPDSHAYNQANNIRWDDNFLEEAMINCRYKKVFFLDLLDFEKDYARTESPELAQKIHKLLEESYRMIGVPIIKVPVMKDKYERAEFILKNL